jgi:hypothetical protein
MGFPDDLMNMGFVQPGGSAVKSPYGPGGAEVWGGAEDQVAPVGQYQAPPSQSYGTLFQPPGQGYNGGEVQFDNAYYDAYRATPAADATGDAAWFRQNGQPTDVFNGGTSPWGADGYRAGRGPAESSRGSVGAGAGPARPGYDYGGIQAGGGRWPASAAPAPQGYAAGRAPAASSFNTVGWGGGPGRGG